MDDNKITVTMTLENYEELKFFRDKYFKLVDTFKAAAVVSEVRDLEGFNWNTIRPVLEEIVFDD